MKDKIIIIGGGISGVGTALLEAKLREMNLGDNYKIVESTDVVVANLGQYERPIGLEPQLVVPDFNPFFNAPITRKERRANKRKNKNKKQCK
jgi:hypothetical protein